MIAKIIAAIVLVMFGGMALGLLAWAINLLSLLV